MSLIDLARRRAEPRTFVEIPRGTRRRVEALIDTLIELLDAIDGDPDIEDDEIEHDEAERGIADEDAIAEARGLVL